MIRRDISAFRKLIYILTLTTVWSGQWSCGKVKGNSALSNNAQYDGSFESDPTKTFSIENTMEIIGHLNVDEMQTENQRAELVTQGTNSTTVKFTQLPLYKPFKSKRFTMTVFI